MEHLSPARFAVVRKAQENWSAPFEGLPVQLADTVQTNDEIALAVSALRRAFQAVLANGRLKDLPSATDPAADVRK